MGVASLPLNCEIEVQATIIILPLNPILISPIHPDVIILYSFCPTVIMPTELRDDTEMKLLGQKLQPF